MYVCTIQTLTRRAQLHVVYDSPDGLEDETDYLNNVFSKNNHNTDFVRRNTLSNWLTLRPTSTLALLQQRLYPTSEAPLKLSQVYYNLTAHKLITTLRQLLTNVKDKDKLEDRQGTVNKIKCCYGQATYISETGRNLGTQLTEHKQVTRNSDVNSHIAEHHLPTKHQIDWDSATCIKCSKDYWQRLTLKSWFTNLKQMHDANKVKIWCEKCFRRWVESTGEIWYVTFVRTWKSHPHCQ